MMHEDAQRREGEDAAHRHAVVENMQRQRVRTFISYIFYLRWHAEAE